MYIPFKLLKKEHLDELYKSGFPYLIVQRLNWPNLGNNLYGLIITPYKKKTEAEMHLIQIAAGNCKIISLPDEIWPILELLDSKEHLVFLNEVNETDWQTTLAKLYDAQIKRGIIDKQLFSIRNNVLISFQLVLGQLIIVLHDEHKIHREPFYDFVMGF